MWLDSAAADDRDRFDILVADPYLTLRTRGASTEIARRDGVIEESQRSPFKLVREHLGEAAAGVPGLPFCGGAVGYFGYFFGGQRAGNEYYATTCGSWRLYSLNCEIDCGTGSAQLAWLQQDLAAHPGLHYLGYLHQPRFSSGSGHGSNSDVAAVWAALQQAGGDVMLSAHDHSYERFAKKDANGAYVEGEYVKAGFLGFSAATGVVKQDFGDSVVWMTDRVGDAVDSLAALPSKIPALWDAAFGDGPREPDSPMGVVGAARVGGEIATLDIPASQQVAMFVMMLGMFNLSLFLFNMLPLLPLDGGHIAGALWESLRRNIARVLRRPDPGPFDVAKLMPVAYVVAGVFVCFTILVLIADVVNPVRIS